MHAGQLTNAPVAEALGFVWAIPRVASGEDDACIDMECWLGRFGADLEAILCHRGMSVLLDTMVVSGHPTLTNADAARMGDEHVVHVYGNFLEDAIACACVDWARTTSNDIWEVYHTLGVEACAHVLFDQVRQVISFDGTYVDDRHILMIVDSMLRGGTIMPLNRHGINRTDASPLMRCSFEETTDVLCDAAIFAEADDNARGVTTSIMTGQLASLGTGTAEVLFPERIARAPEIARGAAMRSTCRACRTRALEESIEYVVTDARPSAARALSPVAEGDRPARGRFRPASPS